MCGLIPLLLLVTPILGHNLISTPDQEPAPNDWDSIIVSSDPIRVTQKQKNATKKADHAIRYSHNTLTEDRHRGRSFKDCPLNDIRCLYNDDHTTSPGKDIVNRFLEKFSGITNATFNEEDPRNESRKSYWSLVHGEKHNHPYDDRKGWVTMDPVPWSTSTVSKWKPNAQVQQVNSEGVGQKPQDERPWSYGYVGQSPAAHWGIGQHDIITDNRPAEFPQQQHYTWQQHNSEQQQYQQLPRPDYLHRPQTHHFNYYPSSNHHFKNYQQGYRPARQPSSPGHPSTYPSEGHGEWVLLSTTKGYSQSQKNKDLTDRKDHVVSNDLLETARNMKAADLSKYHEEDLEGINRKSDDGLKIIHTEGGGSILAAPSTDRQEKSDWKFEETPIIAIGRGGERKDGETKIYRRKVRLTVLPSLDNSSVLSHGGLLEVDSSTPHQTVDEAQQLEEERLKRLRQLAHLQLTPGRNQQRYQLVPVAITQSRSRDLASKKTALLAAIGAGMVPATMAMLIPVALGRRKRSTASVIQHAH